MNQLTIVILIGAILAIGSALLPKNPDGTNTQLGVACFWVGIAGILVGTFLP